MKWFKRIFVSLLLLAAVFVAFIYFYLKSTGPDYSGKKEIAGLKEAVDVKFDNYGVPHIYAKNEHDAYVALGWVHAQDRLFQMEMLRRVTYGRLSEILGAATIDVDKAMISLGIEKAAKECEEEFFNGKSGDFQDAALAYLEGINDFIANGTLPIEFKMIGFEPEPFTPADIYATVGFMSYGFTSALKEDPFTYELYQKLDNEYLTDFGIDSASLHRMFNADSIATPYLHEIWMAQNEVDNKIPVSKWMGSNSWVLGGKRTKSGKPLMANDTHIKYSQPAVWYEAYLNYPGHEFYGYYLAGVPFAIEGHNKEFGWGLTIFPMDNMNLYAETVNPDNPNQYKVGDGWVDFEVEQHPIKIKDRPDLAFEIKYSRHGAVLNDAYPKIKKRFNDKAIALWWSVNKFKSTTLEATYRMAKAKNINEFEKSLELVDILGLNVMYADADGNIAWWATGKLPVYPENINPRMIIDGSNPDNDINGFYPFSKNPKSVNPECGYIITANNPPHAVDGISYPGYYAPGLRAKRIEDLLLQKDKWDVESLKTVQTDVHSDRDLRITAIVLKNIKTDENTPLEVRRLVEYFKNWDGNYDVNSVGATIYTRFLYFLLRDAMMDEMGEETFEQLLSTYLMKSSIERFVFNENSVWWDNVDTREKENRNDIINQALKETGHSFLDDKNELRTDLRWGNAHRLVHIHPIGRKKPFDKIFNVGPFEKSGANEVIDKEGFKYSDAEQHKVISGPALRTLVDFAEPDNAQGIIPTGQSGNVFSPHYSDQAEMFVNGKYRRQIIELNDKDKVSVLKLIPAKTK
jgi:penicillin amidase